MLGFARIIDSMINNVLGASDNATMRTTNINSQHRDRDSKLTLSKKT